MLVSVFFKWRHLMQAEGLHRVAGDQLRPKRWLRLQRESDWTGTSASSSGPLEPLADAGWLLELVDHLKSTTAGPSKRACLALRRRRAWV